MRHAVLIGLQRKKAGLEKHDERLRPGVWRSLQSQGARVDQLALRLELLDPQLVLRRGYAMLTDASGRTVGKAANLQSGDRLRATLADGLAFGRGAPGQGLASPLDAFATCAHA